MGEDGYTTAVKGIMDTARVSTARFDTQSLSTI